MQYEPSHGLPALSNDLLVKIDGLAEPAPRPGEVYAVSRQCHQGLAYRLRTVVVPFSAVHGYRSCARANIRRLSGVPSLQQLLSVETLALDQISHLEFKDDCAWHATDSLAPFQQLRVLRARGARPSLCATNRSLQDLDLGICHGLVDVAGLVPVRHSLTRLTLGSKNLRDISALARIKNLVSLTLGWCISLVDLSALGHCTQLTDITLVGCGASDLSALAGCTRLTTLILNRHGTGDLVGISALGRCTQLTTLNLRDCGVSDISALATCTRLTTLDLAGNGSLADIAALAQCTRLETLDISGCYTLTEISALGTCPLLTSLDMTQCDRLRRIAPLVRCRNLRRLCIKDCSGIADISTLGAIPSLVSLYMGVRYSLHDVPLHRGLRTLYVFCGPGVDFDRFPGLTTLTIDSTAKGDLEGIYACTRLRKLTLVGCEDLVDISALMDCSELTELQIDRCVSLGSVRIHSHPSLQRLRINNCPGLSVEVEDCPRLTSVTVST